MAISYLVSTTIPAAANGTSSAALDSSGGNFIVVSVSSAAAAAAPTLSDNRGNTYTARAQTVESGGGARLQVFYASVASCGAGHTFSLSGAGSYSQAFVDVFAAGGAMEVDQASSFQAAGTVTSIQAGSITPTTDGQLIVMSETGLTSGGTIDQGFTISGFGGLSGNGYGGGQAWLIQGTAAAVNPTWTEAFPSAPQAQIVSFKAAAASTTAATDAVIPALQWSGSVSSAMLAAFAGELPPLAWAGSASGPTPVAMAGELPSLAWAGAALLSAGRLTSRAFHNGAVMPLTSGAIPHVLVCSLDLTSATRYTAQSYNASGLWTIADAAIVPGSSYLVLYSDGAGTYASETLTAT